MERLKTRILDEPILVGRESELEELQGFLESAVLGNGTTVFISGEAGSGKTRLSNEFLEVSRRKEVTILAGWCLSNAAVPYFPFVEAFDSYLSEGKEDGLGLSSQQLGLKSWLMRTIKIEGDQRFEVSSPQAWKDQTFIAVTEELLNLSNNKPLILFIEDVHWADSASLALLHYLSRMIVSERILILATFRSEEIGFAVEGQPNSLAETLRLMGRENLFNEIKLGNLSQSEVTKIAESMLSGTIHQELAEKLAAGSQGNPLFVVESLRLLDEQGSFINAGGVWSISVDKLGTPTKVKDIILRRLSTLKFEQRRVLDAASVVGDKFDPELLESALDQDSLHILETLNAIARSNSLVCCEDNTFRFDHAKSRDVLYEEILPPLRQVYHLRIAEKIESNMKGFQSQSFGDLAFHYTRAGNKEKSIKYSLSAGEDALLRYSNLEAVKHFTYILQIAPQSEEFAKERLLAQEGLGDAYSALGTFDDAIEAYERIITTQTGVAGVRAYRKAFQAAFWRADADVVVHVRGLESKIIPYLTLDKLEAARLQMSIGKSNGWEGKVSVAVQQLEDSLRVFEENNSFLDIADALFRLAHMYALDLQMDKAVNATQLSIFLYEELSDIRGQMQASLWGAIVFGHHCGFVKEALDKYAVAIKIAEKIGDYNTLAWVGLYQGALLESIGSFKEAIETSLRGLVSAQKENSIGMRQMNCANLLRQYTKLGDMEQAGRCFEQLLNNFPDSKITPGNTQAIAVATWSKAVFFAAKNQWKEANDCYETSLNLLKTTLEKVPLEAWTRADYALVLDKQNRLADAKVQQEEARKLALTYEEIGRHFANANLQASFTATKEVEVSESFEVRLALVNVGRGFGELINVEGLIPLEAEAVSISPNCKVQRGSLVLNAKPFGPFQVDLFKLRMQAKKPGVLSFSPHVIYLNSQHEKRIVKPNPLSVNVKLKTVRIDRESNVSKLDPPQQVAKESSICVLPSSATSGSLVKCEFKSEASQRAFDFLVDSFIEDYMHRKLALEKSGWRTFTEIIKQGKVPKFSVYGNIHHKGQIFSELERRGFVELRVFPGERGRGGKITKARICYEKEPIRLLVEQRIMKNK